MDKLDENTYYTILFSFYRKLLTAKQQEIFEDYYYNDFSLFEIAENHGISRNAVFDTLKKCKKALDNYEEQLSLYKKSLSFDELLSKLENEVTQDGLEIIKKLKEME